MEIPNRRMPYVRHPKHENANSHREAGPSWLSVPTRSCPDAETLLAVLSFLLEDLGNAFSASSPETNRSSSLQQQHYQNNPHEFQIFGALNRIRPTSVS
jgi:hypothetical protein